MAWKALSAAVLVEVTWWCCHALWTCHHLGLPPPARALRVPRSHGLRLSLAFPSKEDGEACCCADFLPAILDMMRPEALFPPIKMKLKVAVSCGDDLILRNVAGCQGRDVDSSCFRGRTFDQHRRYKIAICFSTKAGFFSMNLSLAPFCTGIKLPLLPLSVWKYGPHGNPMKTFRKSEKPVLSASWQRYTASGCYQKVARSIGRRVFSFVYPHHEITLRLLLKAFWIFFPSGKQHRCTEVTSYLRMTGFERLLVVSKKLLTFPNSNKQHTDWGVICS